MKHCDTFPLFKGYWWDVIEQRDPRTGMVWEFKTPKKHNIVSDPGRILMAAFLYGESLNGATYHAVGVGNSSWDVTPEDPEGDDFPLVDEVLRLPITSRTFIIPPDTETTERQRIVRFTTVFDYTVLVSGVYIREQGLFGGDATATEDSGFMIDNIRHPKIWKDGNVKLTRHIQIEF